GQIPGLQSVANSFNAINQSLTEFGRAAVAGTAAQKGLNDQTEAAAQKAKQLADAQAALGVKVVDANAAVAQSTKTIGEWQTVVANTTAPSQLATATINAFNQISSARKSIEETGTAAQKAALDTQIKQLQAYASAHGIELTKVSAQAQKAAADTGKAEDTMLE